VEQGTADQQWALIRDTAKMLLDIDDLARSRVNQLTDAGGHLDAALALVERVLPGWAWELTRWTGGGYTTSISQYNPGDEEFRGQGPTPALALLSALLKALSASVGSGEEAS